MKPNYRTKKLKKKIAREIKKIQIFMNTPVYLGLSILEISKIVIYEFWYDYVKLNIGEKTLKYVKWILIAL